MISDWELCCRVASRLIVLQPPPASRAFESLNLAWGRVVANAKHEVECGLKIILINLLSLLELDKDAGGGMQDRMQTLWVRLWGGRPAE